MTPSQLPIAVRPPSAIRRLVGAFALVAALWGVGPGVGSAQLPDPPSEPSEDAVAAARDEFVRGMRLAQRQSWARALEHFTRSYALSGSVVALFNIASTLRSLERWWEATEAFDRLLAEPELDADTRRRAERMRTEAAARVAHVTVREVPDGEALVLTDGRARTTTTSRPIEVTLDPGLHVLSVELPSFRAWRWSGEVADGARLELNAELEPLAGAVANDEVPDERPAGGGGDAWPWVGLAAGVVAALAAVAVGIGVGVDPGPQLEPRTPLVIELP